MQPEIFADKIFYYTDVIPNPKELIHLIEELDTVATDMDAISPWAPWKSSENEDPYIFGSIKTTNESKLASSSSDVNKAYFNLKTPITEVGLDYARHFSIEYVEPKSLSISKYRSGAFMGSHVDHYGTESFEPLMSAVAYLNDDYEGGELEFQNQGVAIKPAAGSVVVFPSVEPFYHQSLPIISGVKYMSPIFWIKSTN
jgi:predicted 2-oxoglutarate/Fe(II)-dependent dioxygenase YbiX